MPAARQRSRTRSPTPPAHRGVAPAILTLDDGRARDPLLAGAKAAALATAAVHHLPVLPGFVVTTAAVDGVAVSDSCMEPLRAAWEALAGPGERALVV
ncbi:MAG TPA: hypothetical protein VHK25_09600, partial [Acidimicrobiales bacterium]|nr:hypothetical protein [Acidimicrobiales bacterium]